MFPAVAAIAGMVALRFIAGGDAVRGATTAFALAFAAAALVLFAATVPPSAYAAPVCDALSIAQLTAVLIGGVGLAALANMRVLATTTLRLAGAAVIAALLAATMTLVYPACLGDPFAYLDLDARMTALWIAHVNESGSILEMLRDTPHEVPPYYGLAVAALVLGALQWRRERAAARWAWTMGLAVLAVLTALALWQVRVASAANALAVALLPAALVRLLPAPDGRSVFLGLGRAALIAAAALNPLAMIAIGQTAARAFDAATGTQRPPVIAGGAGTCQRATDYAPLASLPRGRVLAFIDAGPFLLKETPHGVLAAPYHRDVKGDAAMFDVFLGAPREAAARLTALGVDYLAFCPGAAERHTYAQAAPDGLAAALGRGEIPHGLERIPLDGTELAVYRPRP